MKKLIASLLSLCIMVNITSMAFALSTDNTEISKKTTDSDSIEINGYTYVKEDRQDGAFSISTYKDNALIEKIDANIGQDSFEITTFDSSNDKTTKKQHNLSDFVTLSTENTRANVLEANLAASSSYVYNGRVRYNVLGYSINYPYLYYYSNMYNNYYGSFVLNDGMGTAVSIVLAAITAGFGGYIELEIAGLILSQLGIGIVSNKISSAVSATVNGSVYQYTLKVVDNDLNRTRYYDGTMVSNVKTVNNNTGTTTTKTYYDGCYPQFISRKDTGPAITTASDFFAGFTFSVYSWS